jgi:hypothetical protein
MQRLWGHEPLQVAEIAEVGQRRGNRRGLDGPTRERLLLRLLLWQLLWLVLLRLCRRRGQFRRR